MELIKFRGIVLKEIFISESDKIIVFLTKDYGKISVRARGARKIKSKFLAGTQLFTYADIITNYKNGYYYLSEIDIIESFYNIRKNYEALCYGNYFLELINVSTMESQEINDILLLLIKTLKYISKNKNLELTRRIFEIKFLKYSGYQPEVYNCASCGLDNIEGDVYFYDHLFICSNCKSENMKKINYTTIYTIRHILSSDILNIYSFSITHSVLQELKYICDFFMNGLNFEIKSKKFIQ